jgi:hypothetical protein
VEGELEVAEVEVAAVSVSVVDPAPLTMCLDPLRTVRVRAWYIYHATSCISCSHALCCVVICVFVVLLCAAAAITPTATGPKKKQRGERMRLPTVGAHRCLLHVHAEASLLMA